MTIRTTTTGIVLAVFLLLVAASLYGARAIFQSSFDYLERQQLARNVDRVRQALDADLAALHTFNSDWAWWDDAYAFMERTDPEFVQSNLPVDTFSQQDLAAMLFVRRDGSLAWGRGHVFGEEELVAPPGSLLRLLSSTPGLARRQGVEGGATAFVADPGGPLMVSIQPVLRSDNSGPARGVLLMARRLDAARLQAYARRTSLDLTLYRPGDVIPPWLNPLFGGAGGAGPVLSVGDRTITKAFAVTGPDGAPIAAVSVAMPRDVHALGQTSLRYHLLATILVGGLLCAVILLLLESRVISRVGGLIAQVRHVSRHPEAGHTVSLQGSDELSELAGSIAALLATLGENEQFLRGMMDSLQAGIMIVDVQTHEIVDINPYALAMAERRREEVLGSVCHGLICSRERGQCPITDLGQPGEIAMRELVRADGAVVPVLKSVSTVSKGGREYLLESFLDVSELSRVRQTLAQVEERYRTVFMNTGTGTILVEADTTITLANNEFATMVGMDREAVEGRTGWADFVHPEDVARVMGYHYARRKGGEPPRNYEARLKDGRGGHRDVSLTVALVPGTDQSVASVLDVTESRQAQSRLEHLAMHDELTGLPNRRLAARCFTEAAARAESEGRGAMVGLFMLDLDDFKRVNDSLGHQQGDAMLCLVAERLAGVLRGTDVVARIGGDEFMVVVDNAQSLEALTGTAEIINDAFARPFRFQGRDIYLGVSVGVSAFPVHGGADPELHAQNADLAMFKAKEGGANSHSLFTPDLDEDVRRRLALESELREALDREDFVVHYQPQVRLDGGGVAGVEALVRRVRADGTVVPPSRFVPLAEETGLIVRLDHIVLERACRRVRSLHEAGHPGLRLGVNLSAQHFMRPDLPEFVAGVLERTGFPPGLLELEVTETSLMQNLDEILERVHDIHHMGVRLSLDDFGTGYSSLSYLRRLPFTTIKIDRGFVADIGGGETEGAMLVRSILSLAANLGIDVVGEGVETEEQMRFLRRHGCRLAQGFLFSRPVSGKELERLLTQGLGREAARV